MTRTSNAFFRDQTLGVALAVAWVFCLAPLAAQVIPTGSQVPVKEYPGFFFDRGSDVAVVDLDGNFVVVWVSPNMQQLLSLIHI